jgi:phage baseplate assembly protein W
MSRKQYFDIKYPFTNDGTERYEFDLNSSQKERVASDILHVIFTPKGQRLRKPNFGTDLIKYIFEPNDSTTWGGVKKEIQDSVEKWVSGVKLNNIEVLASDDGIQVYVRIDYSVKQGQSIYNNSIVVEI